jgi:hypothetical protein
LVRKGASTRRRVDAQRRQRVRQVLGAIDAVAQQPLGRLGLRGLVTRGQRRAPASRAGGRVARRADDLERGIRRRRLAALDLEDGVSPLLRRPSRRSEQKRAEPGEPNQRCATGSHAPPEAPHPLQPV